ncbi:MAG TPA: hypothetical protein VHC20_04495 [Candidatus Paceibacterota bacterium]|nr:hypothetical protein [Candidatus Paceibacterota bacterium]
MSESVASEILKLAKVTRQPEEDEQSFLARVVRAANEVFNKDKNDETWETISEPTQNWINECVTALASKDKPPLPPLPGLEAIKTEGSQEEATPGATKKAKTAAAKPKKSAKSGNGHTKIAKARGPKGKFSPAHKIKMLGENPYRDGTKGAVWWGKYKNGMTVQAAIDAGVPRAQVRFDLKKKHISLAS